ncbi:MAG: efflux RND transporter permease subunit [Paracoccaceae bacterium]
MAAAGSETGGVLSYFTRHRTAASFIMVVMLALGLVAATKIRSQFFPDVVVDTVTVTVGWDGAGPEELDRSVVALLEPALQGVEGVTGSTAVSKDNSTTLTLVLEPGWDMARATEEVKAAVEGLRTLPDTADEPVVRRGVWKDKVTEVVIWGAIAPDQIAQIGDDFLARLYRAGITRTAITGVAAPQIAIAVPEIARVRQDISLKEVADAIAREIDTRPAGDVAGGGARLRAGTETRSADEIRDLVVRTNPDGSQLYLRNLATVSVTASDAGRAYYMDGKPAVLIRVDRTAEGDAISMEATVRRLAAEVEPELPAGVQIALINARAQDITDQLDILTTNGLSGLVLVLIVLFLFLSARTAFWVAMGIPVSMLAAVGVMYAAGLTINMMSLFALIITLGIVVDDAIVVAEHADHRYRRLGESPDLAPVNAVRKMLGPVFSSTATTVLAFVALLFICGEFGRLIADIPWVVTAVLVASLIESFLILPNHMRHALVAGAKRHWIDWPSTQFNRGFAWVTDHLFAPAMVWVLRLRYLIVAVALLLLALSWAQVQRGTVPFSFFTAPERGSVTGNFAFLPGATRDEARAFTREPTAPSRRWAPPTRPKRASPDRPRARPGRRHRRQGPARRRDDGPRHARLDGHRPRQRRRARFLGAGVRADADGRDPAPRRALGAELPQPGRRAGGDSLAVNFYRHRQFRAQGGGDRPDRRAGSLSGSDRAGGFAALRQRRHGAGAHPAGRGARLHDRGDRRRAVRASQRDHRGRASRRNPYHRRHRGPAAGRTHRRFPRDDADAHPAGDWVPLGEIVTAESAIAFSTVTRENGRRLVSVTGALAEDDPARAAEIAATLRDDILPAIALAQNVDWDLGGLALQQDAFLDEAMVGFLLCILGIYLVLGWVFGSWFRPLIVMAVIPFGLIGTIWGHVHFGLAMSLFTIIGLIGMSGIIINDAIVLVTTVQDYTARIPILQAAISGTRDRLRPILLTTLTTVLGLAPLMYEESRQSMFLKPTVVTLVYGLSVGFFIVLLMIPSLLVIQADVAKAFASLRRLAGGRRVVPGLRASLAIAGLAILGLELALFLPWAGSGTVPAWVRSLAGPLPPTVALTLAGMLGAAVIAVAWFALAGRGRGRAAGARG